jgi:pimeloyl-ACP methyl ester carboxylesterase
MHSSTQQKGKREIEDGDMSGAPATGHEPAPGLLLRMMEARMAWEHAAFVATSPFWLAAPKGDGHPVFVLPGLAAGDASTVPLRRFLASRGFSPSGWGQGLNLGLREGVMEKAHEKLRALYHEHGRAVSLVGWSLGGLYARELAKQSPEMVRLVITLGSPFTGHPRETNAWRLYEVASGHRVDWHDFHLPLRWAPPVPTTSIWSPTDGVVPWRCCLEPRTTLGENIVVESSHLGLGAHPAALYAVADRLAQPEGHWEPFHRDGWRRLFYGDPESYRRRREAQVHGTHGAQAAEAAPAE